MELTIDLLNEIKNLEKNSLNLILNTKEPFVEKFESEKKKLPYNLNLLDEIHANENAHSRIFVKLLKYTDNGEYTILREFLDFLGPPFHKLEIIKPEISAEKNRIDALIRCNNFTIIIENKIHGAVDQPKQIERYINNEIDFGYKEDEIHILYITSKGGSPSEDSISLTKRNNFEKRYKEINYKNHILHWTQETILPWIQEKTKSDSILQSAIIQYINYLEGLFYQREGEEMMKNEMIKLIKETFQLDIQESNVDKINRLTDLEGYTNDLGNYLSETKKEILFLELTKISENLRKNGIDGIELLIDPVSDFGKKSSEIQFKPDNWNQKYVISFYFFSELSELMYMIKDTKCKVETKENYLLINELNRKLGNSEKADDMWLYWRRIFKDDTYQELINQIGNNKLINFIKEKVTEIIHKTENINLQ